MTLPQLIRSASRPLGFLPVAGLFLAGCASIFRPQVQVAPPAPAESSLVETPVDTAVSRPDAAGRIRQLLHHGFALSEAGRGHDAADSVNAAAGLIASQFASTGESPDPNLILPPDDLLRLTRATLGTARKVLPRENAIGAENALGRLIDHLPAHIRRALRANPDYRELYLRRLAGSGTIPVDLTERVRDKIAFFQHDAANVFRSWHRRSGVYSPLIRKTLEGDGLPQDLVYLSMVESGFNTRAYSSASAVGLWQFVRHTGRLYGLQQNTWVDERRDPEKSTRAAARHLRHLYNLFGDWRLVMTAYNCGQGRLERAMRKDGSSDFWEITSLPRETLNHLPKIMAVLVISKDPAFFGFHDITLEEPFAYDRVRVSEAVDLRVGAECAGTSYETMRNLNPELRLGYSPPLGPRKTYALRVPMGTSERFRTRYARVPESKKVQIVEYAVRYGDTISGIAGRLGVSSRALMDANNIRNPRRLRAGQRLKVPVNPRNFSRASMLAGTRHKDTESGRKVVYTVRGGDTLWDIARAHGVSTDAVVRWNAISPGRPIHPGDRLTLYARTPPRPSGSDPVTYRVRRGDTLWDIARAHGVATSDIRRWNGLGARRYIQPGDRLKLWTNGSPAVADVNAYYRVRRGDTLWDIARSFGTTVDDLRSLNGINRDGQIRAGDRIRVRKDANVE